METSQPVGPTKEERHTTVRFNFVDSDEIYDILGDDFEIGEEITITVTGIVKSFSARNGKEEYDKGGDVELEVISLNGDTKKGKTNKKEMKDMDKLETEEDDTIDEEGLMMTGSEEDKNKKGKKNKKGAKDEKVNY